MALLSNNLPPGSAWKSWAVLIAPSASIFISTLFDWTKTYVDKSLNRRRLKAALFKAKKTLTEALDNSQTGQEHKIELRKRLEELEMVSVRLNQDEIRVLTERNRI